jgi:two-component system, OmpR family, sensor histidine kinase KdpD
MAAGRAVRFPGGRPCRRNAAKRLLMARGRLRVYLGASPGVGKTYEMLLEGHRQREQGVDCVIGFIEPHGRRATRALVEGLEVVPRQHVRYRGGLLPEMDVDAVLARHPQLALVDELAHTNAPGLRNKKRWEDVAELLDAGIDVITTLNIQHLESLGDVVKEVTGVRQRETVPDVVVRRADELELVDLSPEALRRRMVAGNIYAPDRIDAALSHYFRPGNLTALRELALLWMAGRVDEGLRRYREEHGISARWEARERIVVGVSGGPESEALIRRAARLAERTPGSDLMAVHVSRSDGRLGADAATLATLRTLVENLGGSWHQVVGPDVSSALAQFARHENATQVIIGESRPSAWWRLLTGREVVVRRLSRLSGPDLDVHAVTDETPGRLAVRLPQLRGVSRHRRLQALVLMAVLLPAVTVVLVLLRSRLSLSVDLLVYLAVMVLIAVVGGWYPALAAAVISVAAADYFLAKPLYSLRVALVNDVVALVVYLAVAVLVSWTVEVSARRRRLAARSSAEAAALTSMAEAQMRGEGELPQLLELMRETFGLEALSVLERDRTQPSANSGWLVTASTGNRPTERPEQATVQTELDPSSMLAGRGPELSPADMEIFTACAAQVAQYLRQSRLSQRAAGAEQEVESERRRTQLTAAAGRALSDGVDSARQAVAALRAAPVAAPNTYQIDRLERAVDRIGVLAGQLEDLARARAGALDVRMRQVDVAEVVAAALDELGPGHHAVNVVVPEDLPDVVSDAAVLTRAVAALAAYVIRLSPSDRTPTIAAMLRDGRVEIHFQAGASLGGPGSHSGQTHGGFTVEAARDLLEAIDASLRMETGPDGAPVVIVSVPAAAVDRARG